MSQLEVYNILKDKRESGLDEWYSIAEIRKFMTDSGATNGATHHIGTDILQLVSFGYLEVKDKFTWNKKYRIKKSYCGGENGKKKS